MPRKKDPKQLSKSTDAISPARVKTFLRKEIAGVRDSYMNRRGRDKGKVTDPWALNAIACLRAALTLIEGKK